MTSLIYDKCHFELSTGDGKMNIAVSFALHFVENIICHKGVFKTRRPLFTKLSHFIPFYKHFSAS